MYCLGYILKEKTMIHKLSLIFSMILLIIIVGCSDNPPATSFDNFQPEIVNNVDAFEFQITDATHVTTTVNYSWENTGAQASINHSSVIVQGVGSVTLLDADGTQVYTSSLLASSTDQSSAGTAGTWTVRVTFSNASGTMNFRCEKL
jgi:hypothetical protein